MKHKFWEQYNRFVHLCYKLMDEYKIPAKDIALALGYKDWTLLSTIFKSEDKVKTKGWYLEKIELLEEFILNLK